jgi:hypothetical protein
MSPPTATISLSQYIAGKRYSAARVTSRRPAPAAREGEDGITDHEEGISTPLARGDEDTFQFVRLSDFDEARRQAQLRGRALCLRREYGRSGICGITENPDTLRRHSLGE